MADRKPLVVLVVLAVVAIGLYVLGVLGPGRTPTAGGWPDWAAPGSAGGDELTAADLRGGSGCDLAGTTVSFAGRCVVTVLPITEGFGWERVTRRAILTVGAQPVALTVTLAGRTLRDDLDAGDDVRLTFTREGGSFELACASVGGCVAVLSRDA